MLVRGESDSAFLHTFSEVILKMITPALNSAIILVLILDLEIVNDQNLVRFGIRILLSLGAILEFLCVPFVVVDFSSIGQMKTAAGDCMAYTNTVDICVSDMICMLNNFDEKYSCEKEMVSTFLRDRLF